MAIVGLWILLSFAAPVNVLVSVVGSVSAALYWSSALLYVVRGDERHLERVGGNSAIPG